VSLTSNVRGDFSKLLVALPLFFIIMPRPNVSGIQFLTYPAIAFLAIVIILAVSNDININRNGFYVFLFLYLTSIVMLLSMFFNSNFSIDSLSRPVLFSVVLYYGFFITKNQNMESIKSSLLKLAYIVIIIQLIVGLTQLIGSELFAPLYSMEKTRSWGSIVRITGTLTNPNFFSWILIQMFVLIWLFEKRKTKKSLFFVIVASLVFLSGSRSMLLIFPFILLFIEVIVTKKSASFFFIKVPLYGALLFTSYKFVIWFLNVFGSNFRYMRQLLLIFESGDLNRLNSFDHRQFMWERELSKMNSWIDWILGLGGQVQKADNDYIFAVTNFGIIYMILYFFMYLLILFLFSKLKNKKFKVLGYQYIVFSLVLGYQVETLNGWNYPVLIMLYTGIAISIMLNKNSFELSKEL